MIAYRRERYSKVAGSSRFHRFLCLAPDSHKAEFPKKGQIALSRYLPFLSSFCFGVFGGNHIVKLRVAVMQLDDFLHPKLRVILIHREDDETI